MEIDGLRDNRVLYSYISGLNLGSPRDITSINGDDLVQEPA